MNNIRSLRAINARSHSLAGIDKLFLTSRQFSITDVKPLNISPVTKFAGQDQANEDDYFLFQSQGKPIYGSKAYLNTDNFQVNINKTGLQIVLNPSKYLHDYELITDHKALDEVCNHVEKELAENCIRLSLKDSDVARVDIAKQAHMPRSVSHYAPAFDQMSFKGVRSNNVNHGAETFSIRNQSVELQFYDKLKELNPSSMPSNFMRAELRLRKKTAVKRYAGASYLGQIIQMNQEGWNYAYDQYLTKKVFTSQYDQLSFDFAGLDALVDHLITANPNGRGHIATAVEVIGVKTVFEDIGIDRFLAAFSPYVDASTIRRSRQRLFERARLTKLIGEPISTFELINELKNQFIYAKAS
jgi:hypothetical protein